ncbi:MAG: hypothetical protein HQ497_15870 [SAR86 cluster bacterium]|uniref:Uncharacterized protein n=1 Tax=SAR86 cluster bacterium TaxID=2030880 RepID=A0A973AAG8_9GAMM|nr:hypothetical protein [SAR86 cluster bacterium]
MFAMLSRAKDEPKTIIMRFSGVLEGRTVLQALEKIYVQKTAQGVTETELLGCTKLVVDMTAVTAVSLQDSDKMGVQMGVLRIVQVCQAVGAKWDSHSFVQRFESWYLAPVRKDCRAAYNDRLNRVVRNLGLDSAQVHRCVDVTLSEVLIDVGLTAKSIDSLRWEPMSA